VQISQQKNPLRSRIFAPIAVLVFVAILPLRAHAANELSLSPTSLSFGKVDVGQTKTLHVTLTNHGKTSVRITAVRSNNSKFEVARVAMPKVLAAGGKLTLTVTFAPTAPGWLGGHITVVNNSSNRTIGFGGVGVNVQVSASPASVSFGKVDVGKSSTLPVVLTNMRSSVVVLDSVRVTGSAFSVSGAKFPLTLAAGKKVTLNATFKPKSSGADDGSLTVVGPALHIPLSGTGTSSTTTLELTLVPGSLSFGNVTVGDSKTLTLGLKASGGNVTVSSVSSSSSLFAVSGATLPVTIKSGQEASLNVTFTPPSSGIKSGKLSFSSNAANSPESEPLSGTGATAAAHSVTLTWNASTSSVNGYNVYRSTSSTGTFNKINSGLVSATTYNDSGVSSGSTYFYVTTAVNSKGQESTYSNQVKVSVP
jgi:hypothetical protein